MSKLYFNTVAGNRYEGYPVKYINDAGTEFDLVWTPKSDFGYYSSSLRKRCLCNASPYKVMNNTVHTPSAWFDFASDMSFFDPMSVNYLQETVNNPYQVSTQTSYMAAFPPHYNEFIAHNHVIDNNDYYFYPQQGNSGMGYASYFGEPAVLQNSSIVEDDLKKEIFTYSYSCNIEEMEEQFQKDWESICNDTSLSTLSWCRFPITSNKDIDHTRKMSLSVFSRLYEHTLPSGFQHYYEQYTAGYERYTVIENKTRGSIEDTLFFVNASGLYNTRPTDSLIVNREFSEGFPSSLLFVEELYLLQTIGGSTDNATYIIPIRNENDDTDYYFQVITYRSTALQGSPENTRLQFAYLGNIRIQKDKLKNKWIMSFSSPSLMALNSYVGTNLQIGYFEGDGDIDPLTSDDGLELTYVDGLGNKSESPYYKLIKFRNYHSRKGVPLPLVYGDSRWKDTFWDLQYFGAGLKLKSKLYRDDLFKEQTYISVDSGSYTYAI